MSTARSNATVDEAPASEERASDPGSLRKLISAAMERAPTVRRLTAKQRAECDQALADLRAGKARLVREADLEPALEELARTQGE